MKFGFVGTGAMVGAIVRGAAAAGFNASDFVLSNRTPQDAKALADEVGATTARSNGSLAHQVDVLVLGVKPAVQPGVIEQIAHIVRERPEMCVVSLAAGRTLDAILEDFGACVPLVRVMPNVAAQIGQSMSALCSVGATDDQVAAVRRLMDAVGRTVVIDEKLFPVFQSLASCSPAWLFQVIDSLARAGVKHGLPKDIAVRVVAQAMAGSASLVLAASEEGRVPAQLIDQVCSPGGTTIAGLLAAEEGGLSASLVGAVDASIHADSHLG